MKPPNPRQQRILDFVREYRRRHSYGPSLREIMAACTISSTFVADYNVWALVHQGLLKRDRGVARSIREA